MIVQPVLLATRPWLPHVFDFDGQPLPDDADRCLARAHHHADPAPARRADARQIAEDGWFDPLILELDDFEPPRTDDPAASLNPVSQAATLGGRLQHALEAFPDLLEQPDRHRLALARLYRHLPAQTDEEREVVATLDRSTRWPRWTRRSRTLIVRCRPEDLGPRSPLPGRDHRRETPKVGCNDPLPCGSGKKYKNCHGKG